MAYTESTMLPLGTKAPDFRLPDVVSGKTLGLKDVKGSKATVVMFICNHCPFVKYINPKMSEIASNYQKREVGFVGISSNDAENYEQDSPEKMKQVAEKEGYSFPYLYDESQNVARAYHAACTPEFYVFNKDMFLVYRGQMDDARPGNDIDVTGRDLINALEAILQGRAIDSNQKPGAGCNIKWKKGNEPW